MEIKYICTYWGQDSNRVDQVVEKAMNAGYDGIEMNVPFDGDFTTRLLNAIDTTQAIFIAQQWLPPARETVEQYRKRMLAYLNHLAWLNPAFINSHTGKDYFSFEDNSSLIETCRELEEETGIKIIHETHRGRFSHHAASLLPYLERYPGLEINADFSHFCAVSESLLEDQEEIIERILPHTRYIHARVGFDQAAQVNHPFAPEWSETLHRFVFWWQSIIDLARERGEKVFYICPEFGPAPYMPALPFTRKPVSDQWNINLQMKLYLKEKLVP
jgi:sugar phosphate isomerase/epimerase